MHVKRLPPVVPLLLFVTVQAALLFSRIGLLTIWTDELFTLETVTKPATQVLAILRADIHPPLYYLLVHAWIGLPLPGELLERIRMFSAVWTIITTVLIDRLWLTRLRPSRRFVALALWSLSPAVLLYGRMGRSYMMQTALTVLAVAMAWRFLQQPDVRRMLISAAAQILLLYTHYVPGIAIATGFAAVIAIRAGRKRDLRRAGLLAVWVTLTVIAYGPWLVQMVEALGKWRSASGISSRYLMTGSAVSEQVVKLGYGVISLVAGECFPIWVLVSVPVVLLLLLVSLRRLWKVSRGLVFVLTISAVIGYMGVARWVSYPFIPARLLWLLPFVFLWIALSPGARPALRNLAIVVLLVSDAASLISYFSQQNFRNKTYVVPLPQITGVIRESSRPTDSLLLVDGYNSDAVSLQYSLQNALTTVVISDAGTAAEAYARLRDPRFSHVWLLRNTHDISPGQAITGIELAACMDREQRRRLYLPFEPWERAAMRLAGIQHAPSHFYQLSECLR